MATITTTRLPGSILDPTVLPPVRRQALRPSTARRATRALTGALLTLAAMASLAGAAYVVTQRIGFSPVLSPSMEPAFAPGDLLVTRAQPATAIRPGQVVVLPLPDAPGQRYVHRVTEVDRTGGKVIVRTKGDNNPAPDPNRLQVTSPSVPLVVTSVEDAGRLGLLLRGGPLRLALLFFIAICAVVAASRILRGGR